MSADANLQPQLRQLILGAYEEVEAAIGERLAAGNRPSRLHRFPRLSLRINGIPSLDDGAWSGDGPLEYSSLLEPPYGDDEARKLGKFPPARFPAVAALVSFALAHPSIVRMDQEYSGPEDIFTKIGIDLLIARAVDFRYLRYGEAPVSHDVREAVLRPIFKGLFADRLNFAVLAPIALVHFDFDRMRIAPDAYLIRMSPDLQRARWSAKAYGLAGHEQVLAAATHTFVLTGWGIDNGDSFGLYNSLSNFNPEARERINALFAALRIATGVETGYAQEVRLSRGWRHRHNYGLPDVHAAGARLYPEHFDDFGWNRNDLPRVVRDQMRSVPALFAALTTSSNDRLELALRRLNAAMTRSDVADAILDATIALEILLGDGDGQAINWKLRMRGAALAGLDGDQNAGEAMHVAIGKVYSARSSIVHGGRRRSDGLDEGSARQLAIETLRTILSIVARRSEYLDPLRIDAELLRAPPFQTKVQIPASRAD
ncbi:hypothetical protein KPL74_04445 [Bacillus sp. NP157]|nr:hypothetical protein KPL74_04445 [Bacillus sp. NP157]